MAFQQGLSGLNVYSKGLDVVSHNIANASTVGFKASSAHFADVYAGALNGAANLQIGIGVSLAAVQQQFTQGNQTTTGYGMDMMINGNGFFRFQKNPGDLTPYYSRNGQFHLDKDGYVVNSNGCFLTGYDSPDGQTINTASIVPLTVGTGAIPPQQTGWSTLVDQSKGGLIVGVNLDARDERSAAAPGATGWEQLTPFAWDPTFQASMFNYSSSAAIYDQAGTMHTLTNYYVRQGNTGALARTWDVYTVVDNKYLVSATPNQLEFNADGTLLTTNARFELDMSNTAMQDGSTWDLTTDTIVPPPNGTYNWFKSTTPGGFAFYLDLGEMTQFGMPDNVDSIKQDGYIAGSLTNLSVSQEGYVMASYSNGQNKMMGQVVLAEFANPHGLQSTGSNMWIETYTSGQPTIGEPGGGTRGIIQSGSVEDSNTDLTQELVNMIVMQRNYQANAQTIRTQDQLLQTLVNLR
ncbi:MAG: flagellar hook protein FlgE [Zoogloeaceae bacterium]|jgi:flagellar hook protein FlgE|nr:flagellar hook protein FlgE [Zoogloeaceae bacterium]